MGSYIGQTSDQYNRQLHQDEKALNKTEDAEMLKQAIADHFPNIDKQTVDKIFELTQSGMVNFFDNYMLEMTINSQETHKIKKIYGSLSMKQKLILQRQVREKFTWIEIL